MGVEQAGQQLLGRLARVEVDHLLLLAGEQQTRLELEQGRDQDQELGRRLQLELAALLEVVDVGDDDLGQVDLEQIDLLPQHQREQEIERTGEYVEVELEVGETHRGEASAAPGPVPLP